jgi:hypothetical protein
MTDTVWLSAILAESSLILMVKTDIDQDNTAVAIEAGKLLRAGKSVAADMSPKLIWGDEDRKPLTRLPDLFVAQSYVVVSHKAAEILRQFDLGGGALHPVEVVQGDRTTRVPGDYYTWIFGNEKQALLGEQSRDLSQFGPVFTGRWKMPVLHHDDQIAVSRAAIGGPDVWVDPTLFRSVFLSGRLGDALDQAGMRKAFLLSRCRVI